MFIRTFEPNEKMHDNEASDLVRLVLGGEPVHFTKAEMYRRMKEWVEANKELENDKRMGSAGQSD